MNLRTPSTATPLELIFRALSERMRLRILFLLEDGELCVGDIVKSLQAPQAKVSQHLGYLQKAGLVAVRRQGLWRFYQLNGAGSPVHEHLLNALLASRSAVPEAAADRQKLTELQASGGCCPLASIASASRGCRK